MDSLTHPAWLTETLSWVLGFASKLLVNTKQLVVLGQTFSTARSTRLDLSGAESDSEIGNVGILCLSTTV
jgi:hypothetical protein